MNDSPDRDVAVFTEILQLPVSERAAFLERACYGDDELRQRIEALLAAHDQGGDFLVPPAKQMLLDVKLGTVSVEKPGDHIGHYKLLKQIGEGGCGVVYLTEQEAPIRRQVAMKVIKPGMDTKSVIARFEAERQALALMDHPNIAKVFDAGATESGRPYFVMELVRGVKITEYCDRHSLTTDERLNLFILVCQAVQHAHQKGIIHRDIKPSNILVTTTREGAALPVVIDFGIAKATTNIKLTDKTIFTAFEMIIGTPAYMSPEQAALDGTEVDTRTDIYSLGVLLYELLAGSTPYGMGKLLESGPDEIRRVIREQEPLPPSARLKKMAGTDLTTLAQNRKSEPFTLIRSIRGDLDWIAMKAMEKDRARRYATAHGLALDIQRYLEKEAVSARPPSKLYKFQKLVLRNKLLFAGIGIILLLLVASLIIVSTLLARERRSRLEAESASVKSQQTTKFLEDMLSGVGPSVALGEDTRLLRGILDQTAENVGKKLTNQPAVEAELRNLIGTLYRQIGSPLQAQAMHQAALAIYQKQFGPESTEAATSLNDLGLDFIAEDNHPKAEEVDEQALAIRQRLLGRNNKETATSLNDLSSLYRDDGKLTNAEAMAREALEIRQQLCGRESLEVADSLRNQCIILGDEGKWPQSEAKAREVLAIQLKLLGPEHPWVASTLDDIAWAAHGNGNLNEAETLQAEALAMRSKLLPENHPDLADSFHLVGETLRQQRNLDESYSVLSAALSIQRKVLGDDDQATLGTMHSLGLTLEDQRKWTEAEVVWRENLALWRKRAGNEYPQTLYAVRDLSRTLEAEGKLAEAERLRHEELDGWLDRPGNQDQGISYALGTLRKTLEAEGKLAEVEAVRRAESALPLRRGANDNPQTLNALNDFAALLEAEGKWSGAEATHRAELAGWQCFWRRPKTDPPTSKSATESS